MSSAFGGRMHAALTSTVTHPPQGRSSVSLFAHHGELDIVVPPGPIGVLAGLVPGEFGRNVLDAVGLTTAEADQHTSSFRHFAAAILTYRTHNNCKSNPFGLLSPQQNPPNGAPDLNGTDLSVKSTYRQVGDPPNPEVISYRDPTMEHTNLIANRYFNTADVWQFFKDHPRVDL